MPWPGDATGSTEHQTWGNADIGSTWGHSCAEQPCSLPRAFLSNKFTDVDYTLLAEPLQGRYQPLCTVPQPGKAEAGGHGLFSPSCHHLLHPSASSAGPEGGTRSHDHLGKLRHGVVP